MSNFKIVIWDLVSSGKQHPVYGKKAMLTFFLKLWKTTIPGPVFCKGKLRNPLQMRPISHLPYVYYPGPSARILLLTSKFWLNDPLIMSFEVWRHPDPKNSTYGWFKVYQDAIKACWDTLRYSAELLFWRLLAAYCKSLMVRTLTGGVGFCPCRELIDF